MNDEPEVVTPEEEVPANEESAESVEAPAE